MWNTHLLYVHLYESGEIFNVNSIMENLVDSEEQWSYADQAKPRITENKERDQMYLKSKKCIMPAATTCVTGFRCVKIIEVGLENKIY